MQQKDNFTDVIENLPPIQQPSATPTQNTPSTPPPTPPEQQVMNSDGEIVTLGQ